MTTGARDRADDVTGAAAAPSAEPAALAERCALTATEVAGGEGCSLDRLRAAADLLDSALAGAAGRGGGRPLTGMRDAAGDLLAALSAAGVDPAARSALAAELAAMLGDVAVALRDAGRR